MFTIIYTTFRVFLLLCVSLPGLQSISNNECSEDDFRGLVSFKQNLNKGSAILDWNENLSCCDWSGISCDESSPRRVLSISLQSKGLEGSISPGLSNLTNLKSLNLTNNSLVGHIPQELSQLPRLQRLDLSNNNLSGELLVLESIQTLQIINVTSNFFHGNLPDTSNWTELVQFYASNNSLSGEVPTKICQYAKYIEEIDLSYNNFSESLPEGLGICSELRVLDVSNNALKGPIPLDIYNLSSLNKLCLCKNNFTGPLDEAVGNLVNLNYLLLGSNNLSGLLPANLSACRKLKVFTANSNAFDGRVDVVQFGKLSLLENLDLNTNSFSGSIPSSLEDCTSLKSLNMAKNKLTGVIPSGLSKLKNLTTLLISSNSLTGSFSSVTASEKLVSLIISKNIFNETLPTTASGLANLQVLALGNLHLRGTIPEWLKNCTKLQILDLSWNHFEGSLPSWIGSFPHLFYLDLSNNSFSGFIPPELFKLSALIQVDRNLTGLQTVVNNLAIKQKVGAPELQYTQVSAFPPSVYLSHNKLEGPIPSEIGSFAVLLNMDMSFNNLSGSIPDTISHMTDLSSLDLSWNNLSGNIPSSLSHLTFLSYFNVSFNQLVGAIPQANQFSTFSNKSYEGNPGLCGPPLNNSCVTDSDASSLNSSAGRRSSTRIAVLVPVCLLISLIAVVLAWFSWKLSRRNVVYQGNVSFKDLDGPQSLSEALDSPVELFYRNGKLTVFDLFKATNNFDSANIVGCGGFGLVYRADLADGSKLAIKKLTGDCGQMEREFRAEVETLSKAQHKNLVPLQGYLQVGNDKLLLYSYMENGSLDYWLHERADGGTCLDWPMRLRIAQGSAHGLAYLHQVCNPHIVHRDIKSSNILLDEKFQAHLADFGLARLMMSTDTHVTTEMVGTLGYIPPEYCHAVNATPKGDVYSFGVVLLELLTRRRPVDVCKGRGAGDLVEWVLQRRHNGKPEEIFDSVLVSKGHDEQMLQVLDVACPCINPDPFKRPTISDVVNWLDQIGQDNTLIKPL